MAYNPAACRMLSWLSAAKERRIEIHHLLPRRIDIKRNRGESRRGGRCNCLPRFRVILRTENQTAFAHRHDIMVHEGGIEQQWMDRNVSGYEQPAPKSGAHHY